MILVAAPTSTIGRQLVDDLLNRAEPLRLVARHPSRLAPEVRDHVEVVEGSHGDPAVIGPACDGADAVFWLAPDDPSAPSIEAAYVDFTRPACEAFVRHGVTHVVGISALGRGTPMADHAGLVTGSLAMNDLVDMFDAKNDGLDNAEPRTAESTTPTTFRQWCGEVLKPAVDA